MASLPHADRRASGAATLSSQASSKLIPAKQNRLSAEGNPHCQEVPEVEFNCLVLKVFFIKYCLIIFNSLDVNLKSNSNG